MTRYGRASCGLGCLVICAVLVDGLVSLGAQDVGGAPQSPSPLRAAVDLVTLHVTVTDHGGNYVTDLDPDEFIVRENGHPQQLAVFQRGGLPLVLTLLLDTSSSLKNIFPEVQDAAIAFIRQLEARDMVSVIAFDDRVRVLQGFTTDTNALETAIRQAKVGGGTRLYNAVYVALNELIQLGPPPPDSGPRRRVAVVLSDGNDTASLIGLEDLLALAARSDTAIYALRMAPGGSSEDEDVEDDEAGFALTQLAKQTGGRAFLSLDRYGLVSAYPDIRTELGRQYALGYVSTNARPDGALRRISVQVLRAGADARTRRGYFARTATDGMR
jgi:Ca-activated chloride channel homolog